FWGKMSFWFWQIGFWFAFMPLYVLGLMGVTRRMSQFEDPSIQIWFIIAAFGVGLIELEAEGLREPVVHAGENAEENAA
ncbi:hypothetical protein ACC672_37800, partial [Rhizobium ruizarguesonis]